jgi:hypothetical protein
VRAGVDRLLGLGAGDIGLRLGVVVRDVELRRHLHVGEHLVGDVGAPPAGLADLRLEAGRRQQQADLEIGRRLRRGVAQRQRRADQGGAGEGCRAEAATGEGGAAGHCVPP